MFPAEALAAELDSRGRRLVLVTDKRGTAYGDVLGRLERHAIAARSPSVRGPLGRLRAVLSLVRGTGQAARLLRRIRPAAVVGFGGYPSVPPLVATSRMGIPSVIHEQNAVLGRANRLLARRASAIATSFPKTERLPNTQSQRRAHTGNPVRAPIAMLRDAPYEHAAPDAPFRLLVTGGSQGAHVFASIVPAAVAALPDALRRRIAVSQQCREGDLDAVRQSYAAQGTEATVATFFSDMPTLLGAAHLVVCRAGASTIAELAVSGRPAIFVPLPSAADDHQTANARALVDAGAATLIDQDSLTSERLAQELAAAMEAPDLLAERAAAARRFARPDAAQALADLVEEVIRARADSANRAREPRRVAA